MYLLRGHTVDAYYSFSEVFKHRVRTSVHVDHSWSAQPLLESIDKLSDAS